MTWYLPPEWNAPDTDSAIPAFPISLLGGIRIAVPLRMRPAVLWPTAWRPIDGARFRARRAWALASLG